MNKDSKAVKILVWTLIILMILPVFVALIYNVL